MMKMLPKQSPTKQETNTVNSEIPRTKTESDNRLIVGETNPNDRLTYIYVGEVLTQMYVTEYYARFCGRTGILLSQLNPESED